eukprot:CAMPEP_0183366734 /NCGR_PEP_ID=MMETSP0164_2-20130417/89933_1 /TAXON_ID=221442 /ORGANISM="Coccolithus pelagicus ssp braarudi, Strain PLY182g" /LENGTH=73 /DNA_ID=CAMNT_0025542535 /DNA_START=25 /DNA_END=242 /DNA_ORIENTATION=+
MLHILGEPVAPTTSESPEKHELGSRICTFSNACLGILVVQAATTSGLAGGRLGGVNGGVGLAAGNLGGVKDRA